jgi:MtfA peptidase
MAISILFLLLIIAGLFIFFRRGLRSNKNNYVVPANTEQLLSGNVTFYQQLDGPGKLQFESRVKDFLSRTAIRGVDTVVEDIDRVLVAAGAIIPIFSFPDWRYNNLSEVLLYKGAFNRDYQTAGNERDILGMVGEGNLQREMLLSQPSLRSSFQHPRDGHNTAVHEFTHLLDKADGTTDGVPEYLLENPYIVPWIARMRETIQHMKSSNRSDIDLYGATSDAEFFAVISEYFFERPEELKSHHPELYSMLEMMFGR